MRKNLSRILVGLCLALVVFIVVGKAAAAIMSEHIGFAVKNAGENYGVTIDFKDVSFVSASSVTVTGLTVSLPNAAPFFRSESLKVYVNPLAYISKKPFVTGAGFDDAALTIRRDADGAWELSRLRRRAPRSAGDGRPTLAWPLSLDISGFALIPEFTRETSAFVIDELHGSVDVPAKKLELTIEKEEGRATAAVASDSRVRVTIDAREFPLDGLDDIIGGIIDLSTSKVTAAAEFTSGDGERFGAVKGHVSDVAINHDLLSRNAAPGFSFDFDADLYQKGVTLLIRRLGIGINGETISVAGTAARDHSSVIVDLRFIFEHVSLDPLFKAIPRELTPHLDRIDVGGELNGEFALQFDSARPRSLDYGWKGTLDSFTIDVSGPEISVDAKLGPFVHIARLPSGETKSISVDSRAASFISYSNIPQCVVDAVLTAEDGSFFMHKGFSPRHIKESIIENLEAGRVVRGASTVSIQLAKNLFLSRERTLSRKIEEAILTMALEQRVGKKRMLEIYLNIIEWGPGVFGIGPAARHYFDKPATQLDPIESAFLASIIARPNRGWGKQPLNTIGPGWWEYIRIIIGKMYLRGHMNVETLHEAGLSDTQIQEIIRLKGDTGAQDAAQTFPRFPANSY